MSKIINSFQYREFFTEPNNNDNEESTGNSNNIDNENIDNENTDDQNIDDENTDEQNTDEQNTDEQNEDDNTNNIEDESQDEIDDDELDEGDDPEESELNDMLNEDEQDDDELSDDDINSLIGNKFQDDPSKDEIDADVYIAPPIDPNSRMDGLKYDEKLTELDIDDDDDDNLFTQGGAKGQAALDQLNSIASDGDELADLILSVPMDFINLAIETLVKLIGAVLQGPINKTDEYLEPIRQALNGLYTLVQPIVQLINNMIGLPFAIGALLWSTFCNVMKVFGISLGCKTNFQPFNFLIEIFDVITNINPFKLKDFFFNDDYRARFMQGIKDIGKKIAETIILIIKVMSTITKIVEYLINGMKKIVGVIVDVTSSDNLQNFLLVLIMISIIYIVLFGTNKYISIFF
jgi:hypothetical protein